MIRALNGRSAALVNLCGGRSSTSSSLAAAVSKNSRNSVSPACFAASRAASTSWPKLGGRSGVVAALTPIQQQKLSGQKTRAMSSYKFMSRDGFGSGGGPASFDVWPVSHTNTGINVCQQVRWDRVLVRVQVSVLLYTDARVCTQSVVRCVGRVCSMLCAMCYSNITRVGGEKEEAAGFFLGLQAQRAEPKHSSPAATDRIASSDYEGTQ